MIRRPPRSTLSLHDALPICPQPRLRGTRWNRRRPGPRPCSPWRVSARFSDESCRNSPRTARRSEDHTSELQSLTKLVCRLLLQHNIVVGHDVLTADINLLVL